MFKAQKRRKFDYVSQKQYQGKYKDSEKIFTTETECLSTHCGCAIC